MWAKQFQNCSFTIFSRLLKNSSLQSGSKVEDKACSSTSAMDRQIIYLEQLNVYFNNITAHTTTCKAYQGMDLFSND